MTMLIQFTQSGGKLVPNQLQRAEDAAFLCHKCRPRIYRYLQRESHLAGRAGVTGPNAKSHAYWLVDQRWK